MSCVFFFLLHKYISVNHVQSVLDMWFASSSTNLLRDPAFDYIFISERFLLLVGPQLSGQQCKWRLWRHSVTDHEYEFQTRPLIRMNVFLENFICRRTLMVFTLRHRPGVAMSTKTFCSFFKKGHWITNGEPGEYKVISNMSASVSVTWH